jgi:phosphatidylinositol-bisphosphatase
MTTRENEYTNIKFFNIFVATWNVNGRPPNGLLTEWLGADENPPDLYAIAFQVSSKWLQTCC